MIEFNTKKSNVNLTSPAIVVGGGGTADLSNYYNKDEVDALIPDVSGFATTEYVDKAVNSLDIPEEPDLTPYALKTDIPSLDGYAKVEDIPEQPDLSGYAKTEDIPDVSAFQTEEQVNTLISNALDEIGVAEEGAY